VLVDGPLLQGRFPTACIMHALSRFCANFRRNPVGSARSLHNSKHTQANPGLIYAFVKSWSGFTAHRTRFPRKMAGISSCVYCIHAFCRKLRYRDKSGFAFLLVDGLSLVLPFPYRMYNQHTTPNSCQFSPKSCRKAMKQQLYMLVFPK